MKEKIIDDADVEEEPKEEVKEERMMLPMEFASEQNVAKEIVEGSFKNQLNVKVTESEFKSKMKKFLDKKADS